MWSFTSIKKNLHWWEFLFFAFLKQIEKSIEKKEHYIERADGPGEDKPKSTKAPKFTKKYYYSNVVDNTI